MYFLKVSTYVGRKVNERKECPACPACTEEQCVWGGMGGVGRGREAQEGGYICIHKTDSRGCIAETNTAF